MPTVSEFYGILIRMYFYDHAPPHFHARYAGREATFLIENGELQSGSLPPTARRLVREWSERRKDELTENWRRCENGEPLERIEGLE